LTLVPVVDDPDSPGNDAAGVVRCTARRHDQAGEPRVCDVSSNTCCIFEQDGGACGSVACSEAQNEFEHACDGPEDCGTGQICCGEPRGSHLCTAEDACSARRVCHTSGDCPGVSAACVPATTGIADVGYCASPDPSTPGDERPGMIECNGTTVCAIACCVNRPSGVVECSNSSSCRILSETVESWSCDGPEDCSPGQPCCRYQSGGTGCFTGCTRQICHTDWDCPAGECGANGECVGS
jgi:hypothetical protein